MCACARSQQLKRKGHKLPRTDRAETERMKALAEEHERRKQQQERQAEGRESGGKREQEGG